MEARFLLMGDLRQTASPAVPYEDGMLEVPRTASKMAVHRARSMSLHWPIHSARLASGPAAASDTEQLLCAATLVTEPRWESVEETVGGDVKGLRLEPKHCPCSPRPHAKTRPSAVNARL